MMLIMLKLSKVHTLEEDFSWSQNFDGKQIAKDYRQGLKDQVEALQTKGYTPKLSVILVGNDGASKVM